MIEETGRVVAVDGDHVWVETIRQTACKSCELKNGCGQQALAKAFGSSRMHIRMENTLALGEGDCLVLGIEEDALLKGSLFVYLLPLVLMISGAILSEALLGAGDLAPVAGGLAGLCAGFLFLRYQSARGSFGQQPVMLRGVEQVIKFPADAS